MLGKEIDDQFVLYPVVELELGIAETLVQGGIRIGRVLLDGDGRQAAVGQQSDGFRTGRLIVGAGENQAAQFFIRQ